MNLSPWTTVTVTDAASVEMTTLATAREELLLTDAAQDETLARYIRQASGDIVRYCNRDLAQATVTDRFRPPRHRVTYGGVVQRVELLLLSRPPVTAVASVVEDGTTLTTADWELDEDSGRLWRLDSDGNRASWAPAPIAVTYTGGYVMVTGLPDELERACLDLVKARWFARGRDPALRSESVAGVGDFAYQIGMPGGGTGGIPDTVAAVLDNYRRVPL
jgi:hypothetical protein